MDATPRKRRVGIVDPPNVHHLRTPSPKRGRIQGETKTFGDFTQWDENELADFMQNRGCGAAADKFKDNKITGQDVCAMTCRKLEKMGLNDREQVEEVILVLKDLCPWIEPSHELPQSIIHQKVFNDPIHGHIEVHPLCVKIIDTPQFQRLRNIKQLGGCYFVFPGASHNRFEHSIGTSYLAGRLVKSLKKRQPDLNITEKDVLCVMIAGLCHDLGHGPFSHTFDGYFIPLARPDISWKHEKGSVDMFDHLVKANNFTEHFSQFGLTDQDIVFIKELIAGPQDAEPVDEEWPYKGRGPQKSYLYEIVANKRTGIDVDKFDYFARDCHSLGIKTSFDHRRYMKLARVIRVEKKLQICIRDKEAGNIYDMFSTRNCLFRRAYQHKTSNIIELMITEALLKADRHLLIPGKDGKMIPLSETIDDMDAYTKMTDSIYHSILCSVDPKLEEARKIIHRIERRELYKCVGQTILKKHREQDEIPSICIDIVNSVPPDIENVGPQIEADDIVVQLITFDYGMRDRNPIDQVRFYEKHDLTRAMKVRKDQVSQMLPETFAEQQMRIYSKKRDRDSTWKVKLCFFQWCQGQDCTTPKGGDVMAELTPMKGSQEPPNARDDVSQKLF